MNTSSTYHQTQSQETPAADDIETPTSVAPRGRGVHQVRWLACGRHGAIARQLPLHLHLAEVDGLLRQHRLTSRTARCEACNTETPAPYLAGVGDDLDAQILRGGKWGRRVGWEQQSPAGCSTTRRTLPTTGLVHVMVTGLPAIVAGPTYDAHRALAVTGAAETTLLAPGTELPTRICRS